VTAQSRLAQVSSMLPSVRCPLEVPSICPTEDACPLFSCDLRLKGALS
jgi:hypothetical protein